MRVDNIHHAATLLLSQESPKSECLVVFKTHQSRGIQAPPPPHPRSWESSLGLWKLKLSVRTLKAQQPGNHGGPLLIILLCLGQIPVDPQNNDASQYDRQDVLCMCFSPSEETLVASTSKNQLYTITMSLTEISKVRLPQQSVLPAQGHMQARARSLCGQVSHP